MKLLLEVSDNKASILLELLQSISFVKEVKEVDENVITNQVLLDSIASYETGKVKPTPCNMEDLKALVNA